MTNPKELMDKLIAKENISIVDLRQPMDIEAFPHMIPGALRIAMEEVEERHGEIPRDRAVVLYCSRPNEAINARVYRKCVAGELQRRLAANFIQLSDD